MHTLRRWTDKEKLHDWWSSHKGSVKAWLLFFVFALFVFLFFSDQDFSFLLTLGTLVSCFSFLMVAFKIESNQSCVGVSLKMMECYVILLLARLVAIIPFEGYLPYDRSGDWLYQTIEGCTFLLSCFIVYQCHSRYRNTYEKDSDRFMHPFIIIPALILALLIHPKLNNVFAADVSWTFALYLEAFACLPQLFLFRMGKSIEPFTTHFLAGQALSKILLFIFWFSSFRELNDGRASNASFAGLHSFAGFCVIGVQGVQLLVMGDFIYSYIRCLSKGIPVQFLLDEKV